MTDAAPTPDDLVDEWLTLPDVADRLGEDLAKVRRLVQERRLIAVRRGVPPVLSVPARFLVPGHLANPAAPVASAGTTWRDVSRSVARSAAMAEKVAWNSSRLWYPNSDIVSRDVN